jgi:hypothetical protein
MIKVKVDLDPNHRKKINIMTTKKKIIIDKIKREMIEINMIGTIIETEMNIKNKENLNTKNKKEMIIKDLINMKMIKNIEARNKKYKKKIKFKKINNNNLNNKYRKNNYQLRRDSYRENKN